MHWLQPIESWASSVLEFLEPRVLLSSARIPALIMAPGVQDAGDGRVLFYDRGSYGDGFVVRLRADGRLDPSFGGGDGIVNFAHSGIYQALPQADGKTLLLAATAAPAATGVTFSSELYRLNPDGSLDPTFADDGRLRLPDIRGGGGGAPFSQMAIVDDDGGIAVAAAVDPGDDFFDLHTLVVARYTRAGRPDATFAAGGLIETPLPEPVDHVVSIRTFPDGTFGVAAERYDVVGTLELRYAPRAAAARGPVLSAFAAGEAHQLLPDGGALAVDLWEYDDEHPTFAFRKYAPGGEPLASFGDAGQVTLVGDGALEYLYPIAADDGRVFVPTFSGAGDLGVVALRPDGALDLAYGPEGRLALHRDPHTMALDYNMTAAPDGGLIEVHTTKEFPQLDPNNPFPTGLTLSRIGPDGLPVAGFGADGQVTFTFEPVPPEAPTPPDDGAQPTPTGAPPVPGQTPFTPPADDESLFGATAERELLDLIGEDVFT